MKKYLPSIVAITLCSCASNPTLSPQGEQIQKVVTGAAAGASAAAAQNASSQLSATGKVDTKQLGAAAATGAVSGALMATGT